MIEIEKFNIIYADPPWTFKTYSDKGKEKKSAECHYHCMTIEDIYNLPVADIAADDCVLFLWVTFPLLKEGLKVIEEWGFTYKTCAFNWVKRNKKSDSWFWGLGYWTRSNSELCLLATRGCPPEKAAPYIRFAMQELCGIVKNQQKFVIKSLNYVVICPVLSYLQEKMQMDGLLLEMRLTVGI